MAIPYVFIRDDDVWGLDDIFYELFDLLITRQIPVIYGVIPARLETDLVKFLRKAKRQYPQLLDIVQHGLTHANYALPGKPKYEFGPGRTYQQQYSDLAQGMEIVRKRFGRFLTPGFIPPYHGYNKSTLKAIDRLHIPLVSSGKKIMSGGNFRDCPAQVALNRYDKKSIPLPFDLPSMLTSTLKALVPGRVTGLVYHHRAIKTSSDLKAIKNFLLGIARWRDQGKVRLVLFSDLLRADVGLPQNNKYARC